LIRIFLRTLAIDTKVVHIPYDPASAVRNGVNIHALAYNLRCYSKQYSLRRETGISHFPR